MSAIDRRRANALVADLARDTAGLDAKPAAERRIAIMLANDDSGATQARSAIAILEALRDAGYRTGEMPDAAATLADRLAAGPSEARPRAAADETLSFADYSAYFASLPLDLQQRISAHWGAAERDPLFRPGRLDCGRFAIPGLRCGNIAVLLRPVHDDAAAPPHRVVAVRAWLADDFRADAIIDLADEGAPYQGDASCDASHAPNTNPASSRHAKL